jgi:hypothetical protein
MSYVGDNRVCQNRGEIMSRSHESNHNVPSVVQVDRPVDYTGDHSTHTVLTGRRGTGRQRVHGPLWFVFVILLSVVACSLSIGGVLLAARQGPLPPQQAVIAEWEHACQLGFEPDINPQLLANDETPYRASVPGAGKYLADHELDTAGAVTLADLVLAVGKPQAGCLDYGLLHREPVIWVRLLFANGRVEAYSALSSSSAKRLSPDAPVYVLYCYRSGTNGPPAQNESWQGFASLAVYRDCPHGGTAVPR